MIRFVHLHVHTDASKDGMTPVWELVKTAKEVGFPALSMTDHGTLANTVAFTIECQRAGLKPIIGLEAYVHVDGEIGHFTLLADGQVGLNNLIKLNNLGHASSYRHPAFTIDQLLEHSEGLILLSGCASSPLNKMPFKDAVKLQARLMGAFGPRFFQEVMFIADTDTWTRPIQLAEATHARLVVTNDVHFPLQSDASIHGILTQMKAGFEYNSSELWLKRPEQIIPRGLRAGVPQDVLDDAIERTVRIAKLINTPKLEQKPRLPAIENADTTLEALAFDALRSLRLADKPEYLERLKYELAVISKMGFSSYFLILRDIVSWAKANEVYIGPGRGSGGGSLLLYLLGVTRIDPIVYGLSFERFLNPEREGMPDVDVDFDSEHRDRVLEYAAQRWHAVPIATYVRYSHKTLVHDLAKTLHLPRDLERAAAENGEDSDEFRALCDSGTPFEHAYKRCLGQIRHKGKHAGGVIITDQSVPIERTGDTLAASWTEGRHNELSYVGIVKFDLLGLTALSVLQRLEKKTGKRAPDPTPDDPVFELFRKGDLAGIFQFSGSEGIRDLTMRIKPTTFEDLVVINALYRPGALDVGAADAYPEWKRNPRRIHPSIDDILSSTHGAVVYQEQVMAIYARLTGGTLAEADTARRVIVKAKPDDPEWVAKMNKLGETFIDGAMKHGFTLEEATNFWHELAAHSRYSFNRAHAVAYARISWEMAWWKYHYRPLFYAEMLNTDRAQAQAYIMDIASSGIKIHTPHVNVSTMEYEVRDDEIYMPLTSIKYLSEAAATAIITAREQAPFTSYKDFMARIPKRLVRANAREGLFMLHAFSGLVGNPADLQIKNTVRSFDVTSEVQMKYLGVVIPTPEHLRAIRRETARGNVCGIITEKKRKESHHGPYTVYYLSPAGVFWYRGEEEYEVGQLVSAQVRHTTGMAIRVRAL